VCRNLLISEFNKLPISTRCRPTGGFTLVELLVVIAIIAILIALLLPAVQAAREAARRTQCTNHLKQIALGVHNFESLRGGVPPGYLSGHGFATWLVLILPYLEQQELYDQAPVDRQYFVMPDAVIRQQVPFYYCPTRRSPPQLSVSGDSRGHVGHRPGALTDYAMCAGDGFYNPWYAAPGGGNGMSRTTHNFDHSPVVLNGTLGGSAPVNLTYTGWKIRRKFRDVTDGLSNTLLAGEKYLNPNHMGKKIYGDSSFYSDDRNFICNRMAGPGMPMAKKSQDNTVPANTIANSFGSWHEGGSCHFALSDGSVRVIEPSINSIVYGWLANVADENVIEEF